MILLECIHFCVGIGNWFTNADDMALSNKPLLTHKGDKKNEKATEDRHWLSTFSNSGTKSSDWYTVTFRTLARKSIQSAYREG